MEKHGKYAGSVTVGEKGQIVIPVEVRKMMGIVPGDKLLLLADPARGVAIPRKEEMDLTITRIFNGGESK